MNCIEEKGNESSKEAETVDWKRVVILARWA